MLTGFAAGVMVAVSFRSLLQPSLESSEGMGRFSFAPAAVGFLVGIGFLLLLDEVTPHTHMDLQDEGPKTGLARTTKLILAVTLHNIPEGMAVGVVYAGWLANGAVVGSTAALALALGIAIQNYPEGAIVSMPLRAEGMSRGKTFWYGVLSGAVEPIAALATVVGRSCVSMWWTSTGRCPRRSAPTSSEMGKCSMRRFDTYSSALDVLARAYDQDLETSSSRVGSWTSSHCSSSLDGSS